MQIMMTELQEIEREITYWTRERTKRLTPLRQLFWECTLRCNLSCRHCGSDCKKVSEQPDMPLEDFLPVLDEIKCHQPYQRVVVHMVGGEPLVRPDLAECGRAITEKGFYWGTVTNAMSLTEDKLNELLEAGLRTIAISVDGLEEEHNWLRRNERSFECAYNAIKVLTKAPDYLAWDVITCVNSRNFDKLEAIKRMLIDAGVTQWRIFTIFPMGRASDNDELQISDEQFNELMEFIVKTREEDEIDLSYACEGYLGDYEGKVRDYYFSCQAGLSVASVLSDGGISGCLSIRSHYRQGNIYKDSFWGVWKNRFQLYRNHDWMKTGECENCEVFKYCQGNGMHLRDDDGKLLTCHYNRLNKK